MSHNVKAEDPAWVEMRKIFCSNLRLLGLDKIDGVPYGPDIFDHSNPSAFQQVIYFLFGKLNEKQTLTEFRDCWPILDRKQEADFRRKVNARIKELHRDNSQELPYTNPSLFQSPGGRKFIQFLASFSSFVVKKTLDEEGVPVVAKPMPTKLKDLRLTGHHFYGEAMRAALKSTVIKQEKLNLDLVHNRDTMVDLESYFAKFSGKWEESRRRCESIKVDIERDVHKDFDRRKFLSPYAEAVLEMYTKEYEVILDKANKVNEFFNRESKAVEQIQYVMDDSIAKPKLDFSELPQDLARKNDPKLIYESLIDNVKALIRQVNLMQMRNTRSRGAENTLPIKDFGDCGERIFKQEVSLRQLKAKLVDLKKELELSVSKLEAKSRAVDWSQTPLAPSSEREADPVLLLAPTPKLDKASLEKGLAEAMSCGLYTDALQEPVTKSAKRSAQEQIGERMDYLDTPNPHNVIRKFPRRRITPEHSPLLKASLIKSFRRSNSNPSLNTNSGKIPEDSASSVASIEKDSEACVRSQEACEQSTMIRFSPGLSSTRQSSRPEIMSTVEINLKGSNPERPFSGAALGWLESLGAVSPVRSLNTSLGLMNSLHGDNDMEDKISSLNLIDEAPLSPAVTVMRNDPKQAQASLSKNKDQEPVDIDVSLRLVDYQDTLADVSMPNISLESDPDTEQQ